MSRLLAIAVVAGVLFTGFNSASAEIINAGDILRIEFKVDADWTPEPPDVMRLNFGLIEVLSAFTTRIAELYDGNTLLGTASTSSFGTHVGLLNLDPSNSWRTADSLWDFDNPGIADFTTIIDGSIDGRIDFMIATGSVDIPLNQINLNFIKATGPSSGIVVNPPPQINSIMILPTPGSMALLAAIPMVGRRRRRA
jgi:hypothetical protein